MERCPRCRGQVLRNYDEEACLQCGYSPSPPTVLSFSEVEDQLDKTSMIRRNLSDKPSQIRRRRRRLLKAGHSVNDVDRMISLQLAAE